MTHMAEGERLQADIMLISSPQDRKKASLFGDLSETLLMQWQQAVYPAIKMLSYAFGMLWLETVVHPCVESVRSLVLLFGRLVELLLGRRHPKTSEALRKTYGLSPQSAATMRKSQQEGDENWGAILQQACETSLEEESESGGKSANPAAALLPDKLLPDKKGNGDKAAQQSQAPAADEEIRGLDDIFPTPVEGIFSEEKKLTGRRGRFHSRKKSGGAAPMPAALPEKTVAANGDPPVTLSTPVVAEEPIRFDESIRQKVRWPERKALPVRAVGLETTMDLSRFAALANRHAALPVAEAIASSSVLSSSLADGRAVVSSPSAPTASTSTSSVPTPVSTPIPISGDLSQPRQLPSVSAQAERPNPGALPAKKEMARADKPVRQTAIAKTPPQPIALRPSPRFSDPSSVLADEEGRTFDYILHSNKMLANSITHLVDRYFQKVGQEEQSLPNGVADTNSN